MKKIILLIAMINVCLAGCARGEQDEADSTVFSRLKAEYHLTDAQTFELIGKTYLRQDKDAEAEEYFNKAVSLDPTLYLSWYNLGLIHMSSPEYYFKEAIRANPRFPAVHYWLGSFYCKVKRTKESIECFGKFLQVADTNDPQEKNRIEMARCFITEMKAGNDGYISIIGKALSKE